MLIVMTHGDFAEGIMTSARMIVGEMPDTYTIGIQPEMSLEMAQEEFRKLVEKRKEGEHLYVMVDVMFGTPCNVALSFASELENYTIMSGLNLAMLVQFALDGTVPIAKRVESALSEGKSQIIDVIKAFREQNQTNNE